MGRVSDAKQRLMDAVTELIWTGSYGTTTIDHICAKAGVKKGSFYYFFDSKSDLAVTALVERWKEVRVDLDAIFSPTTPPMERLRRYCEFNYQSQAEVFAKHGRVLGCPLHSVGAEVCTHECRLQAKIQEILEFKQKYLESAIRDAHAAGIIHAPDAVSKARCLFAYYQGLITEARIRNDLEILRDAIHGTYDVLGVRQEETESAPA
jgi:TetR/AcrR family transcriptional repressor of nem operon